MKNTKLLKNLINLGLSENEANVYLASLSVGASSITSISRASGIKRTTVYSVIESLKKKGLINIEVKGWKQFYVAESPEKLKFILDEKKNQLIDNLPEFMSMYNLKGGESFIKYYEGIESVKLIYESMIRDIKVNEDYLVISNMDEWYSLDPKYFQGFLKRRAKLNINTKILLQDSKFARQFQKDKQIYNHVLKLLPEGTSLVTNLVITPKRMLIHQLTAPILGIVIENKNIIQMNQQFFEIIWNSIKE